MQRKIMIAIVLVLVGIQLMGVLPVSADSSPSYNAQGCFLAPRLTPGGTGRVLPWPPLPNRIRTDPSFAGSVVGRIPAGAFFSVLSGPVCASGINWWQVNFNGIVGWTAEGSGTGYYVEPWGYTPPPPPPPPACQLPNRLFVGGQGIVTPGLPNVLRDAPGTQSTGANSRVIGEIPAGGVFTVLDGPVCGTDSRWWWYVNYNGILGWTAEGEGTGSYWLEPFYGNANACPGFMPSRLLPGALGAVTTVPNLPNRVRSNPNFGAAVLGQIPPGGVFYVISGPVCGEGTAWWQVNYGGLIGWTAEGQGTTYWLEPR